MKHIVTHINPDLDAISSTWLIRRYYPDFQGDDVQYAFVPAGETLHKMQPDENPDIVHVDTGRGRFDHHQIPEELSAFKVILTYLFSNHLVPTYDVEALKRMSAVITEYDNFLNVYYPNPTADYFDFTLDAAINGLVHTKLPDAEKVRITHIYFDAILQNMKNKLRAEKNLSEGIVFETKTFGKTIVMENSNNDSMKYAQKTGFQLVARKDAKQGYIRIVCVPKPEYDLTDIYHKLMAKDKVGTWFFHQSKHMLINGSLVNPNMVPSPLTTQDIIEILQSV